MMMHHRMCCASLLARSSHSGWQPPNQPEGGAFSTILNLVALARLRLRRAHNTLEIMFRSGGLEGRLTHDSGVDALTSQRSARLSGGLLGVARRLSRVRRNGLARLQHDDAKRVVMMMAEAG